MLLCLDMYITGTDTSSNTINWFLYFLAVSYFLLLISPLSLSPPLLLPPTPPLLSPQDSYRPETKWAILFLLFLSYLFLSPQLPLRRAKRTREKMCEISHFIFISFIHLFYLLSFHFPLTPPPPSPPPSLPQSRRTKEMCHSFKSKLITLAISWTSRKNIWWDFASFGNFTLFKTLWCG